MVTTRIHSSDHTWVVKVPQKDIPIVNTPFVRLNMFSICLHKTMHAFEGTFMLTFYERYYDFYDKNSTLGNLNVWYYYAPSWVDVDAWRAADPTHRTATIVVPYGVAWEGTSASGDRATPAVRKFDDPTSTYTGNINGNSTRDIFLARLGETYLIAAEAYFQNVMALPLRIE